VTYPETIWAFTRSYRMWRSHPPRHAANAQEYVRKDIALAQSIRISMLEMQLEEARREIESLHEDAAGESI
jgi:hypothetical protein